MISVEKAEICDWPYNMTLHRIKHSNTYLVVYEDTELIIDNYNKVSLEIVT